MFAQNILPMIWIFEKSKENVNWDKKWSDKFALCLLNSRTVLQAIWRSTWNCNSLLVVNLFYSRFDPGSLFPNNRYIIWAAPTSRKLEKKMKFLILLEILFESNPTLLESPFEKYLTKTSLSSRFNSLAICSRFSLNRK